MRYGKLVVVNTDTGYGTTKCDCRSRMTGWGRCCRVHVFHSELIAILRREMATTEIDTASGYVE
uniref:SWIM-type domain-containing protein n=1 Tax=Heterorhabditis bacteriophora TaxID=37862 RepID=A0A1I7XGU3_HETBA